MSDEKQQSETINGSDDLVGILKTVSMLGMVVVVGITLFVGIGFLLNHYFGTGTVGIAICSLIGAMFMLYYANKQVSEIMNKLYNEKNQARKK